MVKTSSISKKALTLDILVGCQAWAFDNWKTLRGGPTVFFPSGVRPNEKLSFYAKIFDTVEADNFYYALPRASDIERWHAQTPDHFKFSLKIPKDITHAHGLSKESYTLVEEFIERIKLLKNKVGAILIQLPDSFKTTCGNRTRLEKFLEFLPPDYRYVVELRSVEWFDPEIFMLLKDHDTALCLGQNEFISRETMRLFIEAESTDFAYFRFSGARDLTKHDRIHRPQDESMAFWAEQVQKAQSKGKKCFVYFGDFFEGLAPASAINFRKMLGQNFTLPEELDPAPSLF